MPLMSIDTALAQLRSGINPLTETEIMPLEQALGRVLAVDQVSLFRDSAGGG